MSQILTIQQEKELLNSLKGVDELNHGASRVCYEVGADFVRDFGIDIPECYDELIIKVALGIGGCNQSMYEISAFLDNPTAPLATIFAYGRFIEIMEYVEVIDDNFRDCDSQPYDAQEIFFAMNDNERMGLIDRDDWDRIDYALEYNEDLYIEVNEDNKSWAPQYNRKTKEVLDIYKYWDGDWDAYFDDFLARHNLYDIDCEYPYAFCEKVFSAVCELTDINGPTCDNYQLGETIDGDLVAYDYGYVTNSGNDLCSEVSCRIGMKQYRDAYLDMCIENLEATETLDQINKDMYRTLEDDFLDLVDRERFGE